MFLYSTAFFIKCNELLVIKLCCNIRLFFYFCWDKISFMDANLIQQIKDSRNSGGISETVQEKKTYLIFSVNERLFAFPSCQVKEILKDAQVFPIPFVPSYIKGILNRYGDPYSVIDIASLVGEKEQDSSLFVVINDESQSCLKITDVKEFYTSSGKDVTLFSENDFSDFFEGSLKVGQQDIFIINLKNFLKKVEKDLASS